MMAKGISLHIGVNEIDPGHYGTNGALALCETDAKDMRQIAKAAGFSDDILLTKKATRDGVMSGIKAAAASLSTGDIFFISYAGHGSTVPDTNGDEEDGRDETWCLYDGMMIDDELKALWKTFKPGVRVLIVSDSCHSGTVSRAPDWVMTTDESSLTPRYLPEEVSFRAFRTNRTFYDDVMKKLKELLSKAASSSGGGDASVLLFAGCQDNQKSYEKGQNGMFTSALLSTWNEGQFSGSYSKLYSRICSRMPSYQSPNLDKQGADVAAFVAQRPFTI
jgi:hypothetical protein